MSENKTPNTATETGAVDFTNPESVAAALQAETAAELGGSAPAKKAKKPAGPKKVKVSFTADRDIKAGEVIEFEYELPVSTGTRGAVAGIPLDKMTDDQLKIEYRNANSVAYKTKKAGRDATKAEERLERVKAEMAKRGIQPTARATANVDANTVAKLIMSGKLSVEDIQKLLDEAGDAATEGAAE